MGAHIMYAAGGKYHGWQAGQSQFGQPGGDQKATYNAEQTDERKEKAVLAQSGLLR